MIIKFRAILIVFGALIGGARGGGAADRRAVCGCGCVQARGLWVGGVLRIAARTANVCVSVYMYVYMYLSLIQISEQTRRYAI